jgi:Ca2+-transporting ATPase
LTTSKKYLVYLLSTNISELLILTFAIVMGWPSALLAKHIPYINLATDGSPTIALSTEPNELDIIRRKPRNPDEPIFLSKKMVGTNSKNTCDCNIVFVLEYS